LPNRNLVFVVDDDPGTLKGVKRLLREHGYDSVLFPSAEAFRNHGDFDAACCVILDINLKGESVWPVAAALRDKGTPFVLATGGHVDPPPAEFMDVPTIEKPYTIDRVTPIIESVLARADQ